MLVGLLLVVVLDLCSLVWCFEEQCELGDTSCSSMAGRGVAVRGVRTASNGPMETLSPFLFCVYHKDDYPKGNLRMEAPGVRGNGADFNPNAPFRMYHGTARGPEPEGGAPPEERGHIAGFPSHPHRGFETITATIEGIVDHSDSWGNAGRYGVGDVQWMHAGSGVVHGEMFPLLHTEKRNKNRFFQIWLNLHSSKKMTPPEFLMHWSHEIPKWKNEQGSARVTIWAGGFAGVENNHPVPKDSWANNKANDVCILHITLDQGAELVLEPAKNHASQRMLYFIEGDAAEIDGKSVRRAEPATLIELDSKVPAPIKSLQGTVEFLLLQGAPINEPVAQHGPFVMNTQQEIRQAFADYQRTQFGGWPWKMEAMVFPRTKGRFSLLNGVETAPPDAEDFLKRA